MYAEAKRKAAPERCKEEKNVLDNLFLDRCGNICDSDHCYGQDTARGLAGIYPLCGAYSRSTGSRDV